MFFYPKRFSISPRDFFVLKIPPDGHGSKQELKKSGLETLTRPVSNPSQDFLIFTVDFRCTFVIALMRRNLVSISTSITHKP